jgi:NADPH:quinone reductase-like Zn-dependent oxidoreductase
MRAYRHVAFTGVDGLSLVEEEVPQPAAGQVLVRVRASSLNFRDPIIANGQFPFGGSPGFIALSDGAGEVEAIGDGVTRFTVGDRVVNSFLPTWFGGKLRELGQQYVVDLDGWLTEYRVVSEEALVAMPSHLSFEEGATLPCTAVTAWAALVGVGPGDTVLTQGSGSVSLFALQLARTLGARVIATTSSEAKADRLRALGAEAVIDYVATPEWSSAVLALTDGRGVDRVVEVGGTGTIPQSIKSVTYQGEIALVGMLAPSDTGMSLIDFFLSQSTLRTIGLGSRGDHEDMNRALVLHKVHPVIDRVFPFEAARGAFSYFGEGKHFGKVVISHER